MTILAEAQDIYPQISPIAQIQDRGICRDIASSVLSLVSFLICVIGEICGLTLSHIERSRVWRGSVTAR
ncbi:MAG: hypothetical protein SH850_13010 [Planctomycetaceae bacterium]|nr:hypothetical protein [Planctomycetaceae bacterium]